MSTATARTARVLLTALLPLAALAACSESPTAPGEQPGPQLTTVYDLDVVTRYIEVQASCDRDFLGNFDPGEFQYRIEVSGQGKSGSQESKGYNTVSGDYFQRNGGTTINFTNETYRWQGLPKNATVNVKLSGAEWDLLSKDANMANRSGTAAVSLELGTETKRLTIGADGNLCQIRLVYDVTWTERKVAG
jgi:hypothetical protein